MPPSQHDQGSFTATDDERALDSRFRFEQDGIDKGTAPIKYRLLYVLDGKEQVIIFTCHSKERSAYLRKNYGINLDNVPHALQSENTRGRWSTAIGDKTLVPKLEKQR